MIVALYPQDSRRIRDRHMPICSRPGAIVVDCCGVKKHRCATQLIPLAEEKGFLFVGGHPMAGLEHSGFTYAKKSLFNNASMIFTPTKGPIESIGKTQRPVHFDRLHEHRDHNAGGTRQTDRVHIAAGARRLQRIHQKPDGTCSTQAFPQAATRT